MYLSEYIPKNEIPTWENQNIVIDYPVGTGKTSFIKKTVLPYCKQNKKRVLYLVNRKALKHQQQQEMKEAGAKLWTYQTLEACIKNDTPISHFDWIVCDEAHYFFLDSLFNPHTYLSFQWIMKQESSTKIFISATCDSLLQYFDDNQIQYIPYHGERDYSYIDSLIFFHNIDDMKQIINSIPDDEKILVFTSAQNGKSLHKQFKNSDFLCSESNKKYSDDMKKLQESIEKDECFPSRILFTTIVLDNGINIVDEKVKHVIIDTFDKDTIVQCLGRKRIQGQEKIRVYINNWAASLDYIKQESLKDYEPAEYLKKHGEQAFKLEYVFKLLTIGDCVFFNIIPNPTKTLCVNECKYHFLKKRLEWIEELTYNPWKYVKYIANLFQKEPVFWNKEKLIKALSDFFNSYCGQKVIGDTKETFIKELDAILFSAKKNANWHLTNQSHDKIMQILFHYFLPFGIKESKETKGKYKNRIAWKIIARRVTNKPCIVSELKY